MAQDSKKTGLGKGLGALIPGRGPESLESGEPLLVRTGEVFPNPDQPRRRFHQGALEELASSIKEKGVLQPILVQRVPGGFQLVAGERRLRAAKLAGLERIPVVVKKVTAQDSLEDALVENIQREDLDPLEEAAAYREMQERYGYTQEEVARRVGKERATVANALRLLSLPDFVRDELAKGTISAGHARALLALSTPREMGALLDRVVAKGLSVRETERAAAQARPEPPGKPSGERPADPEISAVERRLERHFGTGVKIHPSRKGGRIEIAYHSLDELNGILDRIFGRK